MNRVQPVAVEITSPVTVMVTVFVLAVSTMSMDQTINQKKERDYCRQLVRRYLSES